MTRAARLRPLVENAAATSASSEGLLRRRVLSSGHLHCLTDRCKIAIGQRDDRPAEHRPPLLVSLCEGQPIYEVRERNAVALGQNDVEGESAMLGHDLVDYLDRLAAHSGRDGANGGNLRSIASRVVPATTGRVDHDSVSLGDSVANRLDAAVREQVADFSPTGGARDASPDRGLGF
jgi:hypothetical protein